MFIVFSHAGRSFWSGGRGWEELHIILSKLFLPRAGFHSYDEKNGKKEIFSSFFTWVVPFFHSRKSFLKLTFTTSSRCIFDPTNKSLRKRLRESKKAASMLQFLVQSETVFLHFRYPHCTCSCKYIQYICMYLYLYNN